MMHMSHMRVDRHVERTTNTTVNFAAGVGNIKFHNHSQSIRWHACLHGIVDPNHKSGHITQSRHMQQSFKLRRPYGYMYYTSRAGFLTKISETPKTMHYNTTHPR